MAKNAGTRWARLGLAAMLVAGLAGSGCSSSKSVAAAESRDDTGADGASTPANKPAPVAPTQAASKPSMYGESSKLPEVQSPERFDAMATLGYRPEWVGYAVMPGGRTVRYVDVFDDIVTVHNSGNLLSALETTTGAVRWSLQIGSPLERFVGTARGPDGDVLACQQGEILIVDSKTGVLKGRQNLAVISNTPPLVFGNIVVFGCPTGEVLAHNLKSGYKQWGHVLTGSINADLVRVGDDVAAASAGGDVVVLEPRRGARLGGARIFGGTDAPLAASSEAVFIASLDQSVWSFGRFGGAARWRERTEFPLRSEPVYHEGSVYVAVPGQGMVCLNAEDGSRLWTAAGVGGVVVGRRGDRLIVWDGTMATTIDAARGDVVARITLPGVERVTTDSFVDGNLYTSTRKGEVGKFSPRK